VRSSQTIRRFFHEARRRKVIGAVVAYAIAAAGVMQAADVVAPRMSLPDATVTIIIFIGIIALPFVAVISWFYNVVPEAPALAASIPSRPGNAVAVLPFVNLSPDPDHEYFADGITQDVISNLSKISQLNVISRRSVMAFKRREQSLREIGTALGATTILEGSVRHVSDRVRISAQLVDVQSDHNLWTETYDRKMTDVFEIQTDVALHPDRCRTAHRSRIAYKAHCG
jgi:TolB-like protein